MITLKASAPHIYSISCPSHLVNICVKTAAKELSVTPEELIDIDIYYYFEKSSKWTEALKQFKSSAMLPSREYISTGFLYGKVWNICSSSGQSLLFRRGWKTPKWKYTHAFSIMFWQIQFDFSKEGTCPLHLDQSIEEPVHDVSFTMIIIEPKVLREKNIQGIDMSNTEIHHHHPSSITNPYSLLFL